jgi:hypothetical protein
MPKILLFGSTGYRLQYNTVREISLVFKKKVFTGFLFRLLSKFGDTDAMPNMLNAAIRLYILTTDYSALQPDR